MRRQPVDKYTYRTTENLLTAQRALWIVCLALQGALFGIIFWRRLHHKFPFFLAFLLVYSFCSALLLRIPIRSHDYGPAYQAYTLILSISEILMVAEGFRLLCERTTRWFRHAISAVAILLCAVVFSEALPPSFAPPYQLVIWLNRWESATFALALPLVWFLLEKPLFHRVRLASEVRAHLLLLLGYLGTSAAAAACAIRFGPGLRVLPVNVSMMACYDLLYAAWIWRFTGSRPTPARDPSGEEGPAPRSNGAAAA